MAALLGVPLDAPHDPEAPPAALPIVRNLTRSRQGFSREVVVEAPLDAEGGIAFLDVEALRGAQPHLQALLNNQLRFLVKVVARVRLAETVADPAADEPAERYSDVWIPLGPWAVPPLARVDERFRRYILRVADHKLEFALQETNYAEDSGKRVVGVRTLMLLAGPAALTANIPAPAGLPPSGGCYQDLPVHLRGGNQGIWNPRNVDHKCFELCVRAHVADVGQWSPQNRKEAAKARGAPFYDEPAPLGPGSARRDARKMVDVGLDFSTLPDGPVSFQDIDNFEAGNSGKVGVYVYEPMSVEWSVQGPSTVRPLREPSVEKPYEHEIVLLLHRGHYSLIYNFSQTSSLRSSNLPPEMRRATTHWHTCPRCQRNMKTEMSLKLHMRRGLCNASPEERGALPNIRLPSTADEAKLYYKPGPSAEWAELVVTADFEVFQENAIFEEGKVVAKQHDVASTCYLAKGRCGYEPPQKHLIRLDRCSLADEPFAIMHRFLRDLLDLSFDYLRWCREVNKSPTFKPGELEAFNAAQQCPACGAPFGPSAPKVLHHRHGTGEFISALCGPCNSSIRRQRVVPVFFHNGGGFDFHYLVRGIAHLRQKEPWVVENEEELEEENFEGLSGEEAYQLASLRFGEDEVDYDFAKLKFQVLVKSGERYLQIRLGPLVFLDSCNIFPASLDALISDLRSTEKDPAKAFPLLAERHPLFARAELFKDEGRYAHPIFAKSWKTNVTFYREHVWHLLLKKLPMPFEKLTGPECWDMDALMPDKSCYDSRLSGETCGAAKYEEIRQVVDFFGFKTFGEFHDAYLHTDMALADVLETYREEFFEHYQLDPVAYITGAAAAWDAMLRRCVDKQQPLGLIREQAIYDIARESVRGGLSNPFQPYARANNSGLGEDYDENEADSYLNKFDVNSQYPTVMSRPLPADGGVLLQLRESKKERLRQLYQLLETTDYDAEDYEETHLVKVTYYVPPQAHDYVDWAPPARVFIETSQLSPYSKELLRNRGWQKAPANQKLMPHLGFHNEESLQLRLLKFYMANLEVRICEVHAIIRFGCRPFMRPFIEEAYARRLVLKRAGRKLQDKVVKTSMCVQFGKAVQNQEAFKNADVFTDRNLYERRMGGPLVVDFHSYPSSAGFLGLVYKKKVQGTLLKSVPQVGTFVLDEARLDIMKYHYALRKIFDGPVRKPVDPCYSLSERSSVRAIYTDTDSDIVHIFSDKNPAVKLAEENLKGDGPCFWDVGGDVVQTEKYLLALGASPEASKLAEERRGELGGFGDEGAPFTIAEVVALGPKCYSEWLTDSKQFVHKFKAKGMAKQHRKQLTHDAYRKAWLEGKPGSPVVSYRFESKNHVVNLTRVEKIGLSPFTDKVWQLDRYNSRPHGHWRNLPEPFPTLCLLAFGLHESGMSLPAVFVDKVLSFLMPSAGYLALELRGGNFVGVLRGLDAK